MKTMARLSVIALLIVVGTDTTGAQEGRPGTAIRYLYSKQRAPGFSVTLERSENLLVTSYRYGKQSTYQTDGICRRNIHSGALESIEVFPGGRKRSYRFKDSRAEVQWEDGRVTAHSIKDEANAVLLESICAFAAAAISSRHVLLLSQKASDLGVQGFWMRRGEEVTEETQAGNFRCVKVNLSLDRPAGLFFALDFFVAIAGGYPFIVRGSTVSGGNFRLERIEGGKNHEM